jgi:hypothetical protein
MTDEDLKVIEARAERSTPDLQYGTVTDDDSLQKEDVIFTFAQGRVATLHHNPSISTLQMCDNGGFFTTARPDALALVAEVRRLRAVMRLQMERAWERGADFYGLDNVPERHWKADRDRDVAKLLATEITDDELIGQTNG